jgi:hypothetical protein
MTALLLLLLPFLSTNINCPLESRGFLYSEVLKALARRFPLQSLILKLTKIFSKRRADGKIPV